MRYFVLATLALLGSASQLGACTDSNDTKSDDDAASPPPPPGDASADAPKDGSDGGTTPSRICTEENWCHTEVPAEDLRAVWGDEQSVWATGLAAAGKGIVVRWDGAKWIVHYSREAPLFTIWGKSSTDLWVGGGGLFHGDGATWSEVDLGKSEREGLTIEGIAGSSASGVWAVGMNASGPRIYHRAPSAIAWERVVIDALDAPEPGSRFTTVGQVFIAGNGDVWLKVRGSRGWLSTDTLFRLPSGSTKWALMPTPFELQGPEATALSFDGVGAVDRDVWLLGAARPFGRSYWVGKTDAVDEPSDWKIGHWRDPRDRTEEKTTRYAVWGISSNDLWTSGAYGRLEHWDGRTWSLARVSLEPIAIVDPLYALWGRSNDDLWAVGGARALHKVTREEAARLEAEHAAKDGGP